MKTSFFDVEKIQQQSKEVDRDQRWFALEGRRFGADSPLPLKVKVCSGGDAYGRAWTKGAQSYSKDLTASKRRQFNESASNPLTMEPDALLTANRRALTEGGALLAVALSGPVLKNPADDLPPAIAEAMGTKRLPEHIQSLYARRSDGLWEIPLQCEPPAEFVASQDQQFRLLAIHDFVTQVTGARRILVDEGVDLVEEELGNSGSGSGTSGPARISEPESSQD